MFFHRILVPTDGSATAQRAALVAADMAKRYGAVLDIVSVIDPSPFLYFPDAGGEAMAYYMEASEAAARQGIEHAEDAARSAGVSFTSHVLREHGPAQSIVAHAGSSGCDLIVIGSHGRRGMDAVLLGSVAQKVLTLATVPVFVIK
ncbi:universal stress protein [Roseateles koreensis]|uniref:Universal stress protein n=1 Tax=Roseateles koreensis TaxID=2987526 RepID=A0ABT5KR55_9BURK|nr:universal stress protein [Roseateles koreensis]MDC8785402.1 universal stress protein [Roseateles koreensis]